MAKEKSMKKQFTVEVRRNSSIADCKEMENKRKNSIKVLPLSKDDLRFVNNKDEH
jgi:hypothetical protein